MYKLNRNDLTESSRKFIETGHSVIDLLNYALEEKCILEELLLENNQLPCSTKLPGIIVQAYLFLSKKFEFDVYGPLNGTIKETLINTELGFF